MGNTHAQKKEEVGLPPRPFLYTIDQISTLTQITEKNLTQFHIYFERRSIGTKKPDQMSARNIAPRDEKPDWRVTDREFVRWMKNKGFRYHDRGYFLR